MKISDFKFQTPYLEELSFEENKSSSELNNKIKMKNKFTITVNRKDDYNEAIVTLVLEINTDVNEAPFKLRIKMSALFSWNDILDLKTVESLLKHNAPALLLGYIRPIVANITNVSKYPVYNLPFVNFVED